MSLDAEVRAAVVGTSLFSASAIAAVVERGVRPAATVVALGLFTVGIGLFFWAYAIAVGRSRTDAIGIGGLFFLSECAPKAVQRSLMASLAVQVAIGITTAALRPYTSSAFGVLAPIAGLGLAGLWGARHGAFPGNA